MLSANERGLLDALEPRATAEDVEIVTIEIVGSKKAPTIRVYLDKPSGVSFDVLASSQVWISDIVERLDPFPGAYTLEVSSPGVDRPLRTPKHFERFAGETVAVKLASPVRERSNWTGLLKGFEDGSVLLDVDGEIERFPIEHIKRARVKGVVNFKS